MIQSYYEFQIKLVFVISAYVAYAKTIVKWNAEHSN